MVGVGGHEVMVVRLGPWLVEVEVEEKLVDDGNVDAEDSVLDTSESEEVRASEEEEVVASAEDNEDVTTGGSLVLLASEMMFDSAEDVLELLAGADLTALP